MNEYTIPTLLVRKDLGLLFMGKLRVGQYNNQISRGYQGPVDYFDDVVKQNQVDAENNLL